MNRSSPWRLWILLSPERGTLGREDRYGWETFGQVKAYADTRLAAFNLQAEHASGARMRRIRGEWKALVPPPAPPVEVEPPPQQWWNRD